MLSVVKVELAASRASSVYWKLEQSSTRPRIKCKYTYFNNYCSIVERCNNSTFLGIGIMLVEYRVQGNVYV